jgi:TolB-like protein
MRWFNQCLILLLVSSCTLSGCTLWKGDGAVDEVTVNGEAISEQLSIVDITDINYRNSQAVSSSESSLHYFGTVHGLPQYSSLQGTYRGRPLTKHIGDYVKNMTQDLVSNMDYVNQNTPIGVTHFSLLDSDLQHTNLLGKQMAESFIHEIHKFRIPVIDFKTTDYIRVTEQGDFVLSRDYLELSNSTGVRYVLTGTLAKHQGGYLVNARIIGMESRAVVATAQTLVPFYVADAVMPSQQTGTDAWLDGVKITDGNM